MSTNMATEALDALLGNGVGTGGATTIAHSIILLDENLTKGRYCKAIQRCFVAEGVDQNQNLFLAGPSYRMMLHLLQNLPRKTEAKHCAQSRIPADEDPSFKIAWRYQTIPTLVGIGTNSGNETKFDLSHNDPEFDHRKAPTGKITLFNEDDKQQPSLKELWKEIHRLLITSHPNTNTSSQKKPDVLRIVLSDLSSPYWTDSEFLPLFLAHLKSFCRHTNALVLVSLDSQLLKQSLYNNCVRYVDAVFQLQKMDAQEQSRLCLRQRIDGGRFFVHKLPTIASTAPVNLPHTTDMLFSLRRSFFELKILHLPPALGGKNSEEETTKTVKTNCGFVNHF